MIDISFSNLSTEHKKILNEIFIKNQSKYIEFCNLIFKKAVNKDFILLHPIFSRNLYQSNLYLNFCHLLLIRHLKKEVTIRKIITSSKIEKKLFTNNFNDISVENNYKQSFTGPKIFKEFLKLIFKSFYYLYTKDIKRRRLNNKENFTLIDTFLTKTSKVKRMFVDRNYTSILDYVNKTKLSQIQFIPTFLTYPSTKILNKIFYNSKENLIFKHDYLNYKDYLKTIIKMIKISNNKFDNINFIDFEVSQLLNHDLNTEKFNTSMFEGILNYRFVKSLKKNNIKVNCLIDWHENQSIDKGLILGFHKFYPKTITKGYQGYIISSDYNWYIKPTKLEKDNGLIPDIIYVIGESLKKRISSFIPNLDVKTAPAYRFKNIFKDVIENKRNDHILVILPIDKTESNNILSIIFQSKVYKTKKILIKPHPLLNLDSILKNFKKKKLKNVSIVYDEINLLLQKCQISIGSSSSSLIESLVRYSPVIIISNNIINNPVPVSINKNLWRVVFNSQEFLRELKFIDKYILDNYNVIESESTKIKKNYYCKPTVKNTNQFLSDAR